MEDVVLLNQETQIVYTEKVVFDLLLLYSALQ